MRFEVNESTATTESHRIILPTSDSDSLIGHSKANYEKLRITYPPATQTSDSEAPFSRMATHHSNQYLRSHLDHEAHPIISFSSQLRHEAIKQGYRLLTSEKTAHTVLRRGFRFCIFNSTRQQITDHLQRLLEDSSKLIYGNNLKDVSSANLTRYNEPLSWMDAPSSDDCCTGEPESNIRDGVTDYVDSDTVVQYLLETGLSIEPGVSSVTVSDYSAFKSLKNGSLFEEIIGNRPLKIDTGMLIQGKDIPSPLAPRKG
jgi:hypothetical protein